MGRTINPRSVRLGKFNNLKWRISSKYRKNYGFRLHNSLDIKKYIDSFFFKNLSASFGFYLSEVYLCYFKDKIIVNIRVVEVGQGDINIGLRQKEYVKNILEFELNHILNNIIIVNIITQKGDVLKPGVVAGYVRKLLKEEMNLGDIIFRLRNILGKGIKELQKEGIQRGYRISIKGRFSKRQRASEAKIESGALKKSSLGCCVDYAMETVILRYGVCSIKVWISDYAVNSKEN